LSRNSGETGGRGETPGEIASWRAVDVEPPDPSRGRPAEIWPGTHHLRGFLDLEEQKGVVERCKQLASRQAGFYTPVVRGGGRMSVQMLCLGLHWNPKTYRYEKYRSDYDGLPVQELPDDLAQLARRAARAAGMGIEPDIGLINFYGAGSRMGLHQDKDESLEGIRAGIPVVSISVGDAARFVIGGTRRKDPVAKLLLESGDAIVFGGPSRLRYHGVTGIVAGTSPAGLGIRGRLNLTFRQY
jgi:DNA alkylation damage repair protein AlkB